MYEFSIRNRRHCEDSSGTHKSLDSVTLVMWAKAACGKMNEAATIASTIHLVSGSAFLSDDRMEELRTILTLSLGEAYMALDLLIQAAGLDPEEVAEGALVEAAVRTGRVSRPVL